MIPKPPDSYMLRNIREVAVPDAVSWFPQTLGWKIVFAAIAIWVGYQIYRKTVHWWNNRYRNEAIDALAKIEREDPNWPYKLVNVIKIVMVYLDSNNASLYGSGLLKQMDNYAVQTLPLAEDEDVHQWLACAENSKLTPPDFEYIHRRLVEWVKVHQINLRGES